MNGELVETVVVDAGAEIALDRVGTVLGRSPEPAPLVARTRAPPYTWFPAPREVKPDASDVPEAPDGWNVEVRIHSVGAVAIRLRRSLTTDDVPGVDKMTADEARRAAAAIGARVVEALEPARIDPYPTAVEPEHYRVLALDVEPDRIESWMKERRRELAALVWGETNPASLGTEAVEDAFRGALAFYREEAVLVGWENAVVLGQAGAYEDVLDVMELANLELLELRTYDAYLDGRLDASYATLERLWGAGGLLRSARGAMQELSEVRAEFARLTENLHDAGKVIGEWYLAKLHGRLADRFHLADWERTVDKKMETLEDLFHLAEEEANHRRAILLEAMIVLLFIVDLVLLFILAK